MFESRNVRFSCFRFDRTDRNASRCGDAGIDSLIGDDVNEYVSFAECGSDYGTLVGLPTSAEEAISPAKRKPGMVAEPSREFLGRWAR
jgi:hypothetical protein